MANSKVTYTGDGTTTNFNVPFPYIAKSDVYVYVNQVLQIHPLNYVWLNTSTIQIKYAPQANDAIEIKRLTPSDTPLVNYQNSAVLTAADLNLGNQQNFYLMQEAVEGFNELVNNTLLNIASGTGIVETETDAVIAALVNEMLNQSAADTLQQRVTDIDNNAEAIISLGNGLQAQINTLAQGTAAVVYIQAAEPVPGVGGIPDPIPDGARWYDTDDNNHPYIYDQSITTWVDIEDPRIGQAVADITVLQTDVDDNAAAIVTESLARSTADSALASTLALIGAETDGGAAFLVDLDTVKVGASETLSERFTSLSASIGTNAANITSEQIARAAADSAIAADLSTLTSTVGGHTSTLTTYGAAIDGIEAEYGVTLDVNGFVSGFKLINTGTGSSAFVIAADKFAIANASNPSLVPFEIIGSKIRMRGDVEVSGSLLLNGTVVGSALVAGTIGSTQIGANAISTSHIAANAVTASQIAANAVTAAKISVTTLAAITANLGSITAGDMTLNSSGFIKTTGVTNYGTGAGVWIGYDSTAYKFRVGNPTGNRMTWDGTTLTVIGDVKVGQYIVDTVDTIAEANTERSVTGMDNTVYTEKKRFTLDRDGDVNLYFDYRGSGVSYQSGWVRWKKNGVVVNSQSVSNTTYATSTPKALTGLVEGDIITVEIAPGQFFTDAPEAGTTYIKNVQLRATVTIPGNTTVNTD